MWPRRPHSEAGRMQKCSCTMHWLHAKESPIGQSLAKGLPHNHVTVVACKAPELNFKYLCSSNRFLKTLMTRCLEYNSGQKLGHRCLLKVMVDWRIDWIGSWGKSNTVAVKDSSRGHGFRSIRRVFASPPRRNAVTKENKPTTSRPKAERHSQQAPTDSFKVTCASIGADWKLSICLLSLYKEWVNKYPRTLYGPAWADKIASLKACFHEPQIRQLYNKYQCWHSG